MRDFLKSAEVEFFRTLNRVAEPMIRRGLGSPRIAPSGFVVVEMVGRVSGRTLRTPSPRPGSATTWSWPRSAGIAPNG